MTRDFVDIVSKNLKKEFPLIQVAIGPRQVGKTYGIKQLYEAWPGPKIYETADLLTPPGADWIISNWKRGSNKSCLLILDEIQKIPNWSEAVKYLFDEIRNKIDMKVILLGSASLSIQEGLTESLAGRFELIKVNHWGHAESNKITNLSIDNYVLFGGYPESYRYLDDIERWQNFMLFSIIEPVITRDILSTKRINKPALFRQTLELALRNPAQEISLQKILGQLQDSGNITTIQHYLNLFEGAFLIKQIYRYSANQLRQKASSPKLIPMSSGLSNAFLGIKEKEESDIYGNLFEACIGAYLSTFGGNLSYWRDGDYEVDYVWELNTKTYAIEVKSGKKRNSASMGKFLKKHPNVIPVQINQENVKELMEKGKNFFF